VSLQLYWRRLGALPRRAAPTSAVSAEVERLNTLLLEVLDVLARHEPGALARSPPTVSDVRRAA
jgi:hypothetical protein